MKHPHLPYCSRAHAPLQSMPRGARAEHGERGVALILVLVFIVLLSVLVVEFNYETRVEASFALNQESEFDLRLAARSAVAQGMSLLQQDLLDAKEFGENYDSLIDSSRWSDGLPFQPLGDAQMRTTISDEFGKINLNALFYLEDDVQKPRVWLQELLLTLLTVRAETGQFENDPKVVSDSILDWLDFSETGDEEERDDGAEDDFYENSEIPYACKNGPMDTIEELLLIRGMTPDFYYGDPTLDPPQLPLNEYLTVHGDGHGRININTALPDVLAVLVDHFGGDPADAGEIELQRSETPLQDVAMIESQFGVFLPELLSGQQGQGQGQGGGNRPPRPQPGAGATSNETYDDVFVVSSAIFRIYGDAMLEEGVARLETFVLRQPLDENLLPGITTDQIAHTDAMLQATGVSAASPEEQFRILDSKFIQ
ncbi:MAG: general secretion pathway protein GspK [Candidatus Hydrogenedentes bacterium]|nr:general secretion pathway protein GspK [Candidatus Hydrogenedentota bacterium]